jgi:predicted DCC family thiol-disulfide oxidoreductase YuxK
MEPGEALTRSAEHSHIVIFDGVCNLCDATVNFIIRRDPAGLFRFVPGETALGEALRRAYDIDPAELDSVVLIRDGVVFTESDAAIEIARTFEDGWRHLTAIRIIPKPLRDWGYRLIARNRYRWFGRKDVCLLPTPELRGRFLS